MTDLLWALGVVLYCMALLVVWGLCRASGMADAATEAAGFQAGPGNRLRDALDALDSWKLCGGAADGAE